MKVIIQTLKNHPFSITACLLYAALFIWTVEVSLRFEELRKHNPKVSGIALSGEGVGFADFFTFLLGALLIIILLVNAAFRKQQRRFYYRLVLVIIIPILVSCQSKIVG